MLSPLTRHRLGVLIGAGAVVLAGVGAANAAGTGLSLPSLNAAHDGVTSCTSAGARVTYAVAHSGIVGGHVVTSVHVVGLAPECDRQTVSVTLTDADGAVLGQAEGPAAGGTADLETPAPIPASDLAGVAVTVTG